MSQPSESLSFVVMGASGDLSRKKILPALFALYCQGHLPERFHVFGFARSEFDSAEFRRRITEHLTCRYAPGESCAQRMEEFLVRCHYLSGSYGSRGAVVGLFLMRRGVGGGERTTPVFYLVIP